jgi:LysM repeat protein
MTTMKRLITAAAVAATFCAWNLQADEAVAYTVVEGEDIQTIAGRYDVTVEDIVISNGLETEEITVGSVIYIPPKHARGYYDPENGTYLVAQGDDLLEIARRFGTTVEALEQANGLDSSKIGAGATLQIPQ